MPAKLLIQTQLGEQSHWIELPVLCIGSGDECDICIDEANLDDHALTIEWRDKRYLVHNRSSQTLYLDGRVINSDSSHPFMANQELQLDDNVVIRLHVEGDGAPAPAPDYDPRQTWSPAYDSSGLDDADEDSAVQDPASDVDEDDTKPASSLDIKTLAQIGVIIFCVVAGGATLFYMNRSPKAASDTEVPTLQQLHVQANQSAQSDNLRQWKISVWKELQRSERARMRGQNDIARGRFVQLRDEVGKVLTKQTSEALARTADAPAGKENVPNTGPDPFVAQVESFIKDRLQQMPRE